jgi:hypothetical protein
MELSMAATQDMLSALAEHASSQSGGSPPPGAAQRRTAFKVFAYMFATAVQVADKTSVPNPSTTSSVTASKRGIAGKKGGGGGGKKGSKAAAASAAAATNDMVDEELDVPPAGDADNADDTAGFDWASLRAPCINLLTEILSADFGKLWSLGVPEEAFVSTFTKTGTRLLSSPFSMKDKEAKRAVEELLAFACAKFPSVVTATVAAIADAITKFEHANDCAAAIGELWAGEAEIEAAKKASAVESLVPQSRYFAPHVAADLLREVGVSNSSDSKDSAGLRRASSFIINVSERSPHLVLTNISVLLPHMERDSHQLRSALVSTLGNIVSRSFSSAALASARSAAEVDAATKTRDLLLDVLVERGHDINAVVRAAALKAWVGLASCAAIPLARLSAVTALAVGRLRDKGAVVRKNAAQLLRALLENNPFGPKIAPELFEKSVKAADEWLKVNAHKIWLRISDKDKLALGSSGSELNEPKNVEGTATKSTLQTSSSNEGDDDDDNTENQTPGRNPTDEDLIADAESQQTSTENLVVTPEVAAYVRAREMYSAAAKFATQVVSAVPTMATELLSSKTSSDVMEAIRFLSRARAFGVPGAEAGLARMLVLVWADGNVKEEVVTTFDKLYILNEALEDEDVEALAIAGGATEDGGETGNAPLTTDESVEPPTNTAAPSRVTAVKSSRAKKATKPKAVQVDDNDDDDNATKKPRKARAAATKKKASQIDDDEDENEGKDDADDDEDAELDDDADEDDDEEGGNGKKKRGKTATKPRASRKKTSAPSVAAAAVLRKATTSITASQRAALDPAVIAQNLVGLLSGAPLAVRTSLEEVLSLCTSRGLIPNGVVSCLWDTVAYGVATLARTRIAVANTLAQQQRAVAAAVAAAATTTTMSSVSSESITSSNSSSSPSITQAQAAAQIKSQATQIEIILQRARSAMSVLTMVAAADPTTIDSLAGLARMRAVLTPQRISGFPSGSGLLRVAHGALCIGPNGVSKEIAASAVDHVLSQGDYRLAKHACAALLRFRGNSLLSVGTSSKAIMAAAAAEEAAAATAALVSSTAASKKGNNSAAATQKAKELEAEKVAASKARAENVDAIVFSLCDLIGSEWDGGGDLQNIHYYAAAQQAIDAIFCLASDPATICAELLREMAARALVISPREKSTEANDAGSSPSFEFAFSSSVSRSRLSRFFFVLGHVPLKTLVHVEALSTRAKLLRIKASEKASHSNPTPLVNSASTTTGKKGSDKGVAAAAAGPKDDIEAQLGSAAAEDEKEAELVVSIAEKELLATQSLCGRFAPLLDHITRALLQPQDSDAATPENETLSQSALLALCKLSAVSSDFCEKQLPLLFTILSRAHNPRIRALTVIALGDLAFRFPNMVEPYTSHLYARLRDADTRVRKNTLMVLTHLILNDMVKVKGQVGEIAVCLSDPEQRISDLTRVFFTELSKRSSNPIYNILPDTLSCLSRLASGEAQNQEFATAIVADAAGVTSGPSPVALRQLDRETFRDIVRFLLSFIGKDKQSDSLAEKLLHRFESTSAGGGEGSTSAETGKQETLSSQSSQPANSSALAGSPYVAALWRDLAFCLSQLPLSEKSIRRMAESVRTYKTALALPDVWESFLLMLNKAKKMVNVSNSAAASAAAKEAAEGGTAPASSTTTTTTSTSSASKIEMRQLVEEWEKALLEARSGAAEDDSALMNAKVASKRARRVAEKEGVDSEKIAAQALVDAKDAAAAVAAAAAPTKTSKGGGTKTTSTSTKTKAPSATASASSAKESSVPPLPPTSRPARKGAARKGIVIEDDDDDDDEEEVVKPAPSKSRSRATTPKDEGGGRKK